MNYDTDLTRIAEIVATSETGVSESHLALTGDKLFLFAETGETCLIYGQRKRTRIALGAPIGKEADAEQLIDQFLKETAAKVKKKPVTDRLEIELFVKASLLKSSMSRRLRI